MGEGPPPLTPWSGTGEGWISDLGSMPCRTRPPRLRPLGGSNSLLRHAERASVSPVPQIPQQEGSNAWGWARGATEGRVCCGPLWRQPELCSTADPWGAQAGLGWAVGTGCLPVPVWRDDSRGQQALRDNSGPHVGGQCSHWARPRGPLHANTVPWVLTCTPFQSPPVHPFSLAGLLPT